MKADGSGRVDRRVCLCATISLDGRLLDAEDAPAREPGPGWWVKLLGRKRCRVAVADTARTLLEAGDVDELCLRVRPCVDGRHSQPTLSGPPGDAPFFARSITWDLVRMGTPAGGDCLLRYRRVDG